MRLRTSLPVILCLIVASANAQSRRQASASNEDFGRSFFDELRSLFGRLQQSDLDRAFDRARAIRCADLAGESLDWKQVAFLNDDRRLGNWHFESIEEVKGDLTKFVFSGECSDEQGPLTVATSYPIQESSTRYTQGRIPLSQVAMKNNPPVPVQFDSDESAYVFELPYVYLDDKRSSTPLYTLSPPLASSRTIAGLAIEFRCKTSGDNDPTYLFLMCRTRMVDHNFDTERRSRTQPAGNAAYYILSDGKEARSTVRLVFGNVDGGAPEPDSQAGEPGLSTSPVEARPDWESADPKMKLREVEEHEFRLKFDSESWGNRIESVQQLEGKQFASAAESSNDSKPSCAWRPVQVPQVREVLESSSQSSVVYTLRFAGNTRSPITAIFEVENTTRQSLSSLRCSFPTSAAPEDITVADWVSVVGPHLDIELHRP